MGWEQEEQGEWIFYSQVSGLREKGGAGVGSYPLVNVDRIERRFESAREERQPRNLEKEAISRHS